MQGDWFSPELVPILQTLTWAGLILLLMDLFWKRFVLLVEIVIRRIEAGSSFKAGPVEVGVPPSVKATSDQIGVTSEGKSGSDVSKNVREMMLSRWFPPQIAEFVYLVHQVEA